MTQHEQLVEALDLWLSLTEFDDQKRSFNLQGWEIKRMSESIREGLELDSNSITGFMLLCYFSASFFRETKFSVTEMLKDPTNVADFMARAKRLQAILEDPMMVEDLRHFQLVTRQAVRHYQADSAAVMAVIEDDYQMAFLRRDALRSMQKLRVDHFLVGEPEPEHVRPRYLRDVFQFWNINSLLQEVCGAPSGVSLSLIKTPDEYQSYFVFTIRNGGHVITLSDIAPEAHPLSRYQSRRPDKAFGQRMYQNWFPYNLMDIKYDEESGRLWIEKKYGESGVVPLNQQGFPLSHIKDLDPPEIIWITLMFELIVDKFWRQPVTPKQLSYTGDMIRVESTLIERASSAGLPVVQYKGLDLQELSVTDVVEAKTGNNEGIGADGGSHNQWMVDRYQHKVHVESMNMLGTGNVKAYVSSENENAPVPLASNDHRGLDNNLMDKSVRYPIHHLDSASFGSREQLEADRLFISRHNLAMEIQRFADQEFAAREQEIKDWFTAKVKKNINRIYALATHSAAWGEYQQPREGKEFTAVRTRKTDEGHLRYQIAETLTHEEWKKEYQYPTFTVNLNDGWNSRRQLALCYITGTVSTYQTQIIPQTKEDLAYLTNTPIHKLPDILQHWHVDSDHKGNHLLSRIDPLAWALENPWQKHGLFNIRLSLSIRALNEIRKTSSLPEGFYPDSGYDHTKRRFIPGLEADPDEA